MKYAVYGVFDGDDLVYQGTRGEVTTKLDISEYSLYEYLKNKKKLKGKYTLKKLGKQLEIVKEKKIDVIEPQKIEDEQYEYLSWHLKYYGNTSSSFDPKPYMEKLKQEGIECLIKKNGQNYYVETIR